MDYRENMDGRIALHLFKTGKTQEQLANEIGLKTGEALSMKRSGKTDFKLSEAVKLAKIMGISLDELINDPV